jgi:membrane-bound serine protease (ClpP class)
LTAYHRSFLALVLAVALVGGATHLAVAAPATGPVPADVVVVRLHGDIDPGMAAFVTRALRAARDTRADVVVIDIQTYGGHLRSAIEIRDAIVGSDATTIAYIKDRAHSAGALIALAAELVAISQGGTFGSAEPRILTGFGQQPADAKTTSAVRGEFESTARLRGRDPLLAAAMVDSTIEVPGVVAKGDLLNVGGDDAVKLGLADVVASSVDDALSLLGYVSIDTVVLEPSVAERIAGFLSGSTIVAILLLVIGVLGLVVEMITPGFGAPGIIGILALAVFFGGRMIAGLAGWESVVLFVAGFVLLLIEVFVIPGFGIAGVSGIAMVFIALGTAFASWTEALLVIAFSVALSVVALGLLARYLSKYDAWGRFVLRTSATKEAGYVSGPSRDDLVGAIGETETVLRPAGVVRIDGQRVDAVSEGEYLQRGVLVQVVDISGNRVVVRKRDQA